MMNNHAIEKFWAHVIEVDEDYDGYVEPEEFLKLMTNKAHLKQLKRMDVDLEGFASLADFMFGEYNGRLSETVFMKWVLDMRRSQKSTVKDHYVTQAFLNVKLKQAVEAASKDHKLSS